LKVLSRYPKHKNPKSIKEMRLYNSTMAISTGFTVGLNVNHCLFSIRPGIWMSKKFVLSEPLRGRSLKDFEKMM
jgi:hypothetical protein